MRKTLASCAVAAAVLLAACGDDGGSSPGLGGAQTPPSQPPGGDVAAPSGGSEGGQAGGDVEQAFCDTFNSMGPVAADWDMNQAAAVTPPAEIADAWQSILDGEPGLSAQSEVTRWVTDNCF